MHSFQVLRSYFKSSYILISLQAFRIIFCCSNYKSLKKEKLSACSNGNIRIDSGYMFMAYYNLLGYHLQVG